jgi:hypothetical protein
VAHARPLWLDELTVEDAFREFTQSHIPPPEVAASYSLEQLRAAFLHAFGAALTLEQRTRRLPANRRTKILDHWRKQTETLLISSSSR